MDVGEGPQEICGVKSSPDMRVADDIKRVVPIHESKIPGLSKDRRHEPDDDQADRAGDQTARLPGLSGGPAVRGHSLRFLRYLQFSFVHVLCERHTIKPAWPEIPSPTGRLSVLQPVSRVLH